MKNKNALCWCSQCGEDLGLLKQSHLINNADGSQTWSCMRIYCPDCKEEIWDKAFGHKLHKCWNCGLAFDNESALTKKEISQC